MNSYCWVDKNHKEVIYGIIFIDYLKISEYYYKKSIPTRSNEIIRKLTTLNVTEEIEKMGNSIEHNCGNISVIRIENNDTCILFYKENIEKIRK